jgi:general secretion pathway protein J
VNRDRGFTLIELLVAMFLLAILGTAGFRMLTQISATRVAIEAQADRLAQLQRTFYWLAEDVTQIVNRTVRSSVDEPLPAFQVNLAGGSLFDLTRAGWVNPVANALPPRSDLQRVSWSLEEDALMRSYWYHLDPLDEAPSRRRQLLDRVEDLRLRYLDVDGEWSDSWPPLSSQGLEDAPSLPRAIEFVFELEDLGDVRRVFALPS